MGAETFSDTSRFYIIKELYAQSIDLLHHLEQYDRENKDREAFIKRLKSLLDARGQVIDHIQAWPDEDIPAVFSRCLTQEECERLMEGENVIHQFIDKVFMDIKDDLKQLRHRKRSGTQYANPFQHLATKDGVFLDKRK